MSTEKTLILVKPDGVRRLLVGEVISRIEKKGYVITGSVVTVGEARTAVRKKYAKLTTVGES